MRDYNDACSDGQEAATDLSERRRSLRHAHVEQAWLTSDEGPSVRQEVLSLDLSKHGVGFRCFMAPDIGAHYFIEIGKSPRQLLAAIRIVAARATDDGVFDVGAEFC